MNTQKMDFPDAPGLADRLDQIGWGIFLMMIGTIWLVPSVPRGTGLVATGALLLLLNAVRYRSGVRVSSISTALGVLALAAGLGELTGVTLPLFPICLVIVGVSMVLKPLIGRKA
jgi:hypothetical protein